MIMLLEVRELKKKFGKKQALDSLSFSVPKGQIIGLLGPNGSGKTTLIKCINDLLKFDEGEIFVDGKPMGIPSKIDISYMPEKTYFNTSWTVKEALDYFEAFYANFDRKRAEELIRNFHLDEKDELKSMSKGMQEKLQLALVMARKAKLYILDEPLGGIDPISRDEILNTILSNFDEKASMIISTHMISEIERILDRALFIKNGKIIDDQMAETIREQQQSSMEEYFRKVIVCC